MGAVFSACALFAATRLAVTLKTGLATPWWANAIGAVAIATLWAWYRVRPKERSGAAGHGTALVATLALVAPVPYGMGSTVWWLSLVGFAVVLLGRRSEARIWAVAIPLVVAAAVLAEPFVQVSKAAGEPPYEKGLARVAFTILLRGFLAIILVAAHIFLNLADNHHPVDHARDKVEPEEMQALQPHQ